MPVLPLEFVPAHATVKRLKKKKGISLTYHFNFIVTTVYFLAKLCILYQARYCTSSNFGESVWVYRNIKSGVICIRVHTARSKIHTGWLNGNTTMFLDVHLFFFLPVFEHASVADIDMGVYANVPRRKKKRGTSLTSSYL